MRRVMTGVAIGAMLMVGASPAQGSGDVTICHVPPGNPENMLTLTLSEHGLNGHLDNNGALHGLDHFGPCQPPPDTPPTDTEEPPTDTEPEPEPPAEPELPPELEPEPPILDECLGPDGEDLCEHEDPEPPRDPDGPGSPIWLTTTDTEKDCEAGTVTVTTETTIVDPETGDEIGGFVDGTVRDATEAECPTKDPGTNPDIEVPDEPGEEITKQVFDGDGNLVEQRVSTPIPASARQEGM